MLVFPQITESGVAQYPLEKSIVRRNLGVRTPGGAWHTQYDPGADRTQWTLFYQGLSEAEATVLQDFFDKTEGRLHTFVFVDPTANLLLWSGDLKAAVWNSVMSTVSGGNDPNGGNEGFLITNGGPIRQGIAQWVSAPANYRYVLSAWMRSAAGAKVYLTIAEQTSAFAMDGNWRRHQFSALVSAESPVRFAIETEPGGVVELFGPQVEAQLAASAYQRTGGTSGVHMNARFDIDSLRWTVDGPNQYRTSITIVS